MQLSGSPASIAPAAAGPSLTVQLSHPYPLPIQGQFMLSVEADTGFQENALNRADPSVRFTNGRKTVDFTIPAGNREASAAIASTGTVAATITATVTNLKAGGVSIRNNPTPRAFRVPRQAPVLTDACYSPTQGGVQATLTGYSTTRQLSSAEFSFPGVTGDASRTISVDLRDNAFSFFASDEAIRTGGAFTLTIPVEVRGDLSAATVTLTNSLGTTASRPLGRCR
jgi:hypothetical protein